MLLNHVLQLMVFGDLGEHKDRKYKAHHRPMHEFAPDPEGEGEKSTTCPHPPTEPVPLWSQCLP